MKSIHGLDLHLLIDEPLTIAAAEALSPLSFRTVGKLMTKGFEDMQGDMVHEAK